MRLPTGQPWTNVGPWVLASLPFVFLVAWFWNRGPGLDADDYGLTLMHAEALLEGRPYGDTGYIATRLDVAPPRQPPGLPLLMAGAMGLAGGFSWNVARVTTALAAFPFFLLAGLVFARTHGTAIGITVMLMLTVALAATPPMAATHVQSDLGFASLVWAVIFVLDQPGRLSWPSIGAVLLVGSIAMGYRFLGVVIVPTVALFALTTRDRGGLRLWVPLAAWGLVGVGALALLGWGTVGRQASLSPVRWLSTLAPLIRDYGRAAVQAHTYPLPWNLANDAFHVVSLILTAVGVVVWSKTGRKSAAWLFTVVYLLTLSLVFNRSGRYLIPVFPVLIFGFLQGFRLAVVALRRPWSVRYGTRFAAVSGTVLAASALVLLVAREPRAGGYLAELPEARELFDHLTSVHDTVAVRVGFVQPRVLAWSTGIPAMVTLRHPPELMMPELDRLQITHVVTESLGLEPLRTAQLQRTIAANVCRFELTFDNSTFRVYRLLPTCREERPS